jgi:hypothetical protein
MDMVERVARVVANEAFPENHGIHDDAEKGFATRIARAAIAAMREPTVAMRDAPYSDAADMDIYWGYNADGRPGSSDDVWRIMIDAALGETP